MDILIATTNQGKLKEYRQIFADAPAKVLSLADVGLADVDIEEPFNTFAENAVHKAQAYAQMSGLLTIADDSGLEVDALDGRPGVFSARYAPTAEARIEKLLGELQNVPDEKRTARFQCVIAAVRGDQVETFAGVCEGHILHTVHGTGGFGYDPIFQPVGYEKTFSELTYEEKNAISHRGIASRGIAPKVLALLTE